MVDVPKHVREDFARWLIHSWEGGKDREKCALACGITEAEAEAIEAEDGDIPGKSPVAAGIVSQADLDAAVGSKPLRLDFALLIHYPEVAKLRAARPTKFTPARPGDREPEPTDPRFRSLGNMWLDEAFGIGMVPSGVHSLQLDADEREHIDTLAGMAWQAITEDITSGRLEVFALRYNDRPHNSGGYPKVWATRREPVPADEFFDPFEPPLAGPARPGSSRHSYNILWRRAGAPQDAPWLDPWVRPGPLAAVPRRQKGNAGGRPPVFSDDELAAAINECPRFDYRGVDNFGSDDEHAEALRVYLARKHPDRKISSRTLRDSVSKLRRATA